MEELQLKVDYHSYTELKMSQIKFLLLIMKAKHFIKMNNLPKFKVSLTLLALIGEIALFFILAMFFY